MLWKIIAWLKRRVQGKPIGTHKHMCRICGFVWRHSDACAGSRSEHACASCGWEEYHHYDGPFEPCDMFMKKADHA
jgi:hypothetical protein